MSKFNLVGDWLSGAAQPDGSYALSSVPDGVADGTQFLAWDGTPKSTTGYSTAFIEVTAMGTATAIVVNGGVAAANALQVINLATNATSATITTTGLYVIPAVGNLTLTGLGTAVVNLMLKR